MTILVTNDDGIFAPGLAALSRELSKLGEVVVVAPESEQSAVGHAISLITPLRVKKTCLPAGGWGWAVSGTPADCVKIALAELLPQTPEMVVSGINLGPNVGINVLYSGTVSAATEAAILGVKKSVAVSLNTYKDADFATAARLVRQLLQQFEGLPLQGEFCLNINLPALKEPEIKGVRLTRQDTGRLVERFERRVDPREHLYYWLAGINERKGLDPETDYGALQEGYISVTPLHHDLTDYAALERLKDLQCR